MEFHYCFGSEAVVAGTLLIGGEVEPVIALPPGLFTVVLAAVGVVAEVPAGLPGVAYVLAGF